MRTATPSTPAAETFSSVAGSAVDGTWHAQPARAVLISPDRHHPSKRRREHMDRRFFRFVAMRTALGGLAAVALGLTAFAGRFEPSPGGQPPALSGVDGS